jgi:hypothetical protein
MNEIADDVLERIFCFVGDGKDLAACEKTNRTFRRVLRNDAIWGFCEEAKEKYLSGKIDLSLSLARPCYPKPSSNRETVFVVRALNQCHHWQRSTDSVILDVIDVQQWKNVVTAAMKQHLPRDLVDCRHSFPIRGDTAAVLLTLVEDCLQLQLDRTNLVATFIMFTKSIDEFYTVSAEDFLFQSFLQRMDCTASPLQMCHEAIAYTYNTTPTFYGVTSSQRDQIVRRFAYKAGITKMNNDMYPEIWAAVIQAIVQMVKPACIMLADRRLLKAPGVRRPLQGNETIRDVSPFPEVDADISKACPHCHKQRITHWIVPKQIEDAARFLRIGRRVVGEDWLVANGDDVETEKRFAESKYYFKCISLRTKKTAGKGKSDPSSKTKTKNGGGSVPAVAKRPHDQLQQMNAAIPDWQQMIAAISELERMNAANPDLRGNEDSDDDESYTPEDDPNEAEEDFLDSEFEEEAEDCLGTLDAAESFESESEFYSDRPDDSDEENDERYLYSSDGPDDDLALFAEEIEGEVSQADVVESRICSQDYYSPNAFERNFWDRVLLPPY